eukprot:TRINITY_DN785_c0_g1_i1.p1 TRINITY_DN785_c0_g1~~TRINITY_DN785_c0_g1_i1.p1  ORF type:complete len:532 (+),score=121.36 TRINITY_DN785_c0_g1_i1:444-2039(+)
MLRTVALLVVACALVAHAQQHAQPDPAHNDVPKQVAGAAVGDPVKTAGQGSAETHYHKSAFNHNWNFEQAEDFPAHPLQKRTFHPRLMGGPYPTTTTTPLYEYYSRKLHDHYYTTKWNDLRDVSDDGKTFTVSPNWDYRGVVAFIFVEQQPGTVPLYLYWNLDRNDHAVTTDHKKFGVRKEGYKFQRVLGYVFPRPKPGTYSINEFYDKSESDHMLSEHRELDFDPKHPESSHYRYLSTPFYAFRTPNDNVDAHMPKPIGHDPVPLPEIPPKHGPEFDWKKYQLEEVGKRAAPLQRYYSAMYRDHLMTINKDLIPQDGAGTWGTQNVLGYCYHGEEPGTVPLHRYYNRFHHNHFYTTDAKEPLKRYGWIWLGVECYVYATAGHKDTVPLKRWFHLGYGDHMYTTGAEKAPEGYAYERITAYVRTNPGTPSLSEANQATAETAAGSHTSNPTGYQPPRLPDSSLDELGDPDAVNMKGQTRVPENMADPRPTDYDHVQQRETTAGSGNQAQYKHQSHAAMASDTAHHTNAVKH